MFEMNSGFSFRNKVMSQCHSLIEKRRVLLKTKTSIHQTQTVNNVNLVNMYLKSPPKNQA